MARRLMPNDDDAELDDLRCERVHRGTHRTGGKATRPGADPAPHGGPNDKNRTVLHALCRLLVEKGVIGRSELQKVVSELALK